MTEVDGGAKSEGQETEELERAGSELSELLEELLEDSGKIPKPDGEVGRPNRGGYNLEAKLGSFGLVSSEIEKIKVYSNLLRVELFIHADTEFYTHTDQDRPGP